MKVNLHTYRKVRIEMLPLIDIVFLLLVFFIYAMLSMAVHRGLPVILPSSKSAKTEKKMVLTVTIKADETIFVDKQRVSPESLTEVLKKKSNEEKQTGVLLFADRNLTYQSLFKVLDDIRLAGLSRISLQAEVELQP